jgi:hypothetical protein
MQPPHAVHELGLPIESLDFSAGRLSNRLAGTWPVGQTRGTVRGGDQVEVNKVNLPAAVRATAAACQQSHLLIAIHRTFLSRKEWHGCFEISGRRSTAMSQTRVTMLRCKDGCLLCAGCTVNVPRPVPVLL